MTSRESNEQGRSGRAGAEASQPGGSSEQPRQGSDRVERPSGPEEEKHRFAGGRAPSEQGENANPSPESIARDQQGYAGAGGASGSHGGGDRSEQRARSGEPQGDHTRHGRQKAPGDRSGG